MKDMTVEEAEQMVNILVGDSNITLDELEDFGFLLLKSVAVVRSNKEV